MNQQLLQALSPITEEEEQILEGNADINRNLYFNDKTLIIDSKKLLASGKLIRVRPHTRFVHFPAHTHNYIEMIYMCSGETPHIINKNKIVLRSGDLLLNQNVSQEILPADRDDIAINFIILPEFFDLTLSMLGTENSLLKDFLVGCLRSDSSPIDYLHFEVADVIPVQNLIENLIWTVTHEIQNKRFINQTTMGLLFLTLMNHIDKLVYGKNSYEQELSIRVLQYIEEHYRDGELTTLSNELNCEFTWLSKTIKKITGSTYTELVQTKRLNQACYLLSATSMSVTDISLAVGYDNFSYFYRIFKKNMECPQDSGGSIMPAFRDDCSSEFLVNLKCICIVISTYYNIFTYMNRC